MHDKEHSEHRTTPVISRTVKILRKIIYDRPHKKLEQDIDDILYLCSVNDLEVDRLFLY